MTEQKLSKSPLKVDESDLEICVSCGDLTDVKKSTPVDERYYYIGDGGGQLDEKCYLKIYKNCI